MRSLHPYTYAHAGPSLTPTHTRTPTTTATNTPTQAVTSTGTSVTTTTATSTSTAVSTGTSTPTTIGTNTATVTPSNGTYTPTPSPTECAISFSDVQPTDYFYVPVQYLYCRGVISGYADGTFRPSNDTTRGQLSKIVVLAYGLPAYSPLSPTFFDVATDNPFYQYIETAYHNGIISGYADGTFRPGNKVTRGQLCKIIVIAAGWSSYMPPAPSFTDVPTDHPFYTYIETAHNHGIISGYIDGTFRPGNNATRGQISKIVYNAVTNP